MDKTRETKSESFIRQTINAAILAGMIILLIGMFYSIVKAGIPYQDPPLELQIQYAINKEIGDILVKDGFLITICGGMARVVLLLILKKRQKK